MDFIKCDVAIVGGGASGLMTAVALARSGVKCKTVILEHHNRTGKKLMATGNGRCNLSNSNIFDSAYYGTGKQYANKIFKKYSCEYITYYFQKIGLITVSDAEGRVYPVSNNVSSVLDSMRNYILSKGVIELCETTVTDVKENKNGYVLLCGEKLKVSAKYVVLACGGKASPKLSTDGLGYTLLKKLNIKVTPLLPSLVSVNCSNKSLNMLKGIRIKGNVFLLADNKIVETQSGEIQFANNALSGICVFQLSRMINEYFICGTVNGKKTNSVKLVLDIMPNYTAEQCKSIIMERAEQFGGYSIEKFFDGFLHRKVAIAIFKECNINNLNRKTAELTKKEIEKLALILKHWEFTPSAKSSFDNAQVTAGGVVSDEINFHSMESKKHKNLYIIGEFADVDGICGGYNLHWAWCSGIITAENIVRNMVVSNG
ncbi:MAG: aminoacetone oxidase family FAD-binding enzyme [Acutalibacteraceae bacterium]|nr:aminoacetone oxidase family FAD-binding enzyme [Acutalibacteraceae bacterium]